MDSRLDPFIEALITKINNNLETLITQEALPNDRETFVALQLPIYHALKTWGQESAVLAQNTPGFDHEAEVAKLRRKLTYIFNRDWGRVAFHPTPTNIIDADVHYAVLTSTDLDNSTPPNDNAVILTLNTNPIDPNSHHLPDIEAQPVYSNLFSREATNQIGALYRRMDALSRRFGIDRVLKIEAYYAVASYSNSVYFSQHSTLNGPYFQWFADITHKLDFIIYEYQRYPWWLKNGVYALQALSNLLLIASIVVCFSYFIYPLFLELPALAIIYFYLKISCYVEILDRETLYSAVGNILSREQIGDFYRHYLKEHLLATDDFTHYTEDAVIHFLNNSLPSEFKDHFEKEKLQFLQAHYERLWGLQYLKVLLDTIYRVSMTSPETPTLSSNMFKLFLWVWTLPMLCIELIMRPIQLLFIELLSRILPLFFWGKAILTLVGIAPLLVYDYCFPSEATEEQAPSTISQVTEFLSLTLWSQPAPPQAPSDHETEYTPVPPDMYA